MLVTPKFKLEDAHGRVEISDIDMHPKQHAATLERDACLVQNLLSYLAVLVA